MVKFKLYHGTSSKCYEKILRSGFNKNKTNYTNWLAPSGVYLFCSRPLLAFKYAVKKSRSDKLKFNDNTIKPVVFEVKLKKYHASDVLDLTTDDGIYRLHNAHQQLKILISDMNSIDNTCPSYKESIEMALGPITESYNFDSKALELMITRNEFKIVIAAIQEGLSLNRHVHSHRLVYDRVPGYCGIRLRDHLEACVVETKIINKSFSIVDIEALKTKYDDILHETLSGSHDPL